MVDSLYGVFGQLVVVDTIDLAAVVAGNSVCNIFVVDVSRGETGEPIYCLCT